MSAPQQRKFHTDEVDQWLHKKCVIHGVPNVTLFDFVSPGRLLDGKVLCSTANKLQQNSNAFSEEEYVPGILTVPW